jgi:hypothetical protein
MYVALQSLYAIEISEPLVQPCSRIRLWVLTRANSQPEEYAILQAQSLIGIGLQEMSLRPRAISSSTLILVRQSI